MTNRVAAGYCNGFMCSDRAVRNGKCIYHFNLGGANRKNRPCPRCGVVVSVHPARKRSVCRDCNGALSAYEKKLWE